MLYEFGAFCDDPCQAAPVAPGLAKYGIKFGVPPNLKKSNLQADSFRTNNLNRLQTKDFFAQGFADVFK